MIHDDVRANFKTKGGLEKSYVSYWNKMRVREDLLTCLPVCPSLLVRIDVLD